MLTVSKFVGAFLHGLTMSRTMSDGTSFKVAQQYLKHDYLRGFPVPRMTLKHVDLEVNFTVGPTTRLETLLKEPEISKNIAYQFRELLASLPNTGAFKAQIGPNAALGAEWDQGIEDLVQTVQRILSSKISDKETLVHTLTLAMENFFHGVHQAKPEKGLLSGLRNMFTKPSAESGGAPITVAPLRGWARQKVSDILDSAVPGGIGGISELPDLNILVGGAELESQNPANLHKAKLSFAADDRKWVASEKNGEKNYILDR